MGIGKGRYPMMQAQVVVRYKTIIHDEDIEEFSDSGTHFIQALKKFELP